MDTLKTLAATTGLLVAAFGGTAYAVADKPITVSEPSIVYSVDSCPENAWGCYSKKTPDVVYVHPDLIGKKAHDFVVAHEVAHFEQHRNGRILDECEANDVAFLATGNRSMYEASHSSECADRRSL